MRGPSMWAPRSVLLVLLMAVGSALMWIGLPAGLIYVASLLADSSAPSLGPYLLVLIGLPVGMAIIGKALGWLDRQHMRLTGVADVRPYQPPWLRSLRGERAPERRRGVLDTVMISSVVACLVAFAIWFFALAGSSLPT